MLNKNNVLVRAKDQQIYHLHPNIKNYSPLIINLIKDSDHESGPINLALSSHQIMLFSQYFAARNFELPIEFTAKKLINTDNLRELLSKEDFEILNDWPKEDVMDLLEVSIYLEVDTLTQILLTKIASGYFVNIGENAVDEFRTKNGLEEEISESKAMEIKKDFKWAFCSP